MVFVIGLKIPELLGDVQRFAVLVWNVQFHSSLLSARCKENFSSRINPCMERISKLVSCTSLANHRPLRSYDCALSR
jgi:hypothetical protein